MKKIGILLTVCLLAMAVLFLGCGGDGGGGTTTQQPDPNILRITGVPAEMFAQFYGVDTYIGVFTQETNISQAVHAFENNVGIATFQAPLVAGSAGENITGTPVPVDGFVTVEFPLFTGSTGNPWSGSGTYRIGIIVLINPIEPVLFYTTTGGPINLSTGTTQIPFSHFSQITEL